MFFTAFGIISCMIIGLAFLVMTCCRWYPYWYSCDGSMMGFIICVVLPFCAGLGALYLTFANAPLRIVM